MGNLPPLFSKYDMVRLKREETKSGIVWKEPIRSDKGWQYEVFFSADDIRYIIESDLKVSVDQTTDKDGEIYKGDINDLKRNLLLVKLKQPLADHLYGLYGSRTKFEVYQFKPALKFLNNPEQRILIADEVGLGKTIEAGIIYLELQARLELQRVLIICPPALQYKWQDEMRSRFDEDFTILDREKLDRFFNDYERIGENTNIRGIITLHRARRAEITEKIAELGIQFDLVIIDEAHHMRNPTTLSNNLGSVLSDNSDAMLLLTATPLHLGNQDLFYLLQLLSPGEFDNLEAFGKRIEPNRHINKASQILGTLDNKSALAELRKIERTTGGRRFVRNPYYQEVIDILKKNNLPKEQLVKAQRHLLELNTLAHIFTRTRKREVVTNAPMRVAHTLKVNFNSDEREFYEGVIKYVRDQYQISTGGLPSGWVTIMRERQTASCIPAVHDYFRDDYKDKYIPTSEDISSATEILADEFDNALHTIKQRIPKKSLENLIEFGGKAKVIDSKFDVFQHALREILEDYPESKVLVFSFFRGTLEYLYKKLIRLGYKVVMIHGGVKMDERNRYVENFRENPNIQILLSSEVGSEGLDFQFCNTLFNYDLPWNPMKVEQRIGRLDRFGQKHDKINIYNLVIENSIEERIFLRLYERIGIFKEFIGDLEAILGDEIRGLQKSLFSTKLSPAQEKQLAEQAANNIIRRKLEQDDFEKHRLQFMGQDAIFSDEIRDAIEKGKYISETEIQALVNTFVNKKFSRTYFEDDEEDSTSCLYIGDDFKQYIKSFIYRTQASNPSAQLFLQRIANGKMISTTFRADIAFERKLVEFLTLRHPLTQAAIKYWNDQPMDTLPVYEISIEVANGASGEFYFFIFIFKYEGIQNQSQIISVVVSSGNLTIDEKLSNTFMRLLQKAFPTKANSQNGFNKHILGKTNEVAIQYIAEKRDEKDNELQRSNDAMINSRISALEQSFEIKNNQVEGYLRSATDNRIIRMRKAQLRNLEAKYQTKIDDLENLREVSVSYSLEMAGVANIINIFDNKNLEPTQNLHYVEEDEKLKVSIPSKDIISSSKEATQNNASPPRLNIQTPSVSSDEVIETFPISNQQIRKLSKKNVYQVIARKPLVLDIVQEKTKTKIQVDRKRGFLTVTGKSKDQIIKAIQLLQEYY
jgi:ATP-dependent helicase HepA